MKNYWPQLEADLDAIAKKHKTGPYTKVHASKYREVVGLKEPVYIGSLKRQGWKVYRNGWPDVLAVRGHEARLIEIKRPGQRPTESQIKIHHLFKKHFHIDVKVVCLQAKKK